MKLRISLYAGAAIAFSIMGGGVLWLSKHREFADPTWLDHEPALMVQAAWIQAIFSIIAIATAITLGEIQHWRMRDKIKLDAAQQKADRDRQIEKSRAWILHILRTEKTHLEIGEKLIKAINLREPKVLIQGANSEVFRSMLDIFLREQFLTSHFSLAQLENLSGVVHMKAAKAAGDALAVRSHASIGIGFATSQLIDGETLLSAIDTLKNACTLAIASITQAIEEIEGMSK